MQIRIEVLSCSADKQICMYHKLKSDHQSSLHNVTVAVQWGVWWRGPSEQLYHQWDQHYDNHLTTIYLLRISQTIYRSMLLPQLHWYQRHCHIHLLWRWS